MSEKGFTIVELMGALALATVVFFIAGQFLVSVGRTQGFQRDRMRIADHSDRILHAVRLDMSFAVRVFTDGPEGSACLGSLALEGRRPVARSRLAAATSRGYFDIDPKGVPQTGNMLLLARAHDPFVVKLGRRDDGHRIDTYQFVCYFLASGKDGSLDLVRWASMPLLSHANLQEIADTSTRRRILSRLHTAGLRFAWSVGNPHGEALYEVRPGGFLVAADRPAIPGDRSTGHAGFLGRHGLVVAEPDNGGAVAVPLYMDAKDAGAAQAGFEVKVDGPLSARLVLVRLVVTRPGRPDRALENRCLASCRGL